MFNSRAMKGILLKDLKFLDIINRIRHLREEINDHEVVALEIIQNETQRLKKKSCEATSKNLKQIDVNKNSLRTGKAKGPGKIIAKGNEVYFITVRESIQQDITI